MNSAIPPPFSTSYSPDLAELFNRLNCSLAITTFQSGKLIFVSPGSDDSMTMMLRSFHSPMGLCADEHRMALATKDEVIVFGQSPRLAISYLKNPGVYDSLYVPVQTHYTGQVAIHDIAFIRDEIYAVNTAFSCIVKLGGNCHFTPVWKPGFITQLASEDRCHLNGMAVENEEIRYVTALGTTNGPGEWRKSLPNAGVLMDVKTGDVLAGGLQMPHSPRIIKGKLYLLFSATSELVVFDRSNYTYTTIYKSKGFYRGLAHYGDYLFIGVSRLRKNSSSFGFLELNSAPLAGVLVIHEPTAALIGELKFNASVDEIYDVQILPNLRKPNVLNTITDEYKRALILPDATFWAGTL